MVKLGNRGNLSDDRYRVFNEYSSCSSLITDGLVAIKDDDGPHKLNEEEIPPTAASEVLTTQRSSKNAQNTDEAIECHLLLRLLDP
ncbi:hypothetical protein EGR_08819 [Echinococcus granulosus]|uniref:Uncharacterized protein n=1 Tax=Echinococcus granulosus TaxID=6210 RepID=W6USD0_ECHGR|nr:hypothetical protein EGR_08819 [Echinococcus granulosus]EUB56344.1 hypothetical protein EGR_08819 [Echinococcus granulosus]